MWPIERLVPYEGNVRRHPQSQIDLACDLIQTYGWTVPIVVNCDGLILAGHGRLLAAKRLQMSEVPVIVLSDLTPEQERAYRLADNKLPELAEDDVDLLTAELLDLRGLGIDWSTLGWSDDDVASLLSSDSTEQQNEEKEDESSQEKDWDEERSQPLAIVLKAEEYRDWREIKEKLGLSSDRNALLRLMKIYSESFNG